MASERLAWRRSADGTLVLVPRGRWHLSEPRPSLAELDRATAADPPARIEFACDELERWDSVFLAFVMEVVRRAAARQIPVTREGLPRGVRRLLSLAESGPPRPPPIPSEPESLLDRVGAVALERGRTQADALAFIGATAGSLLRFLAGRARFRSRELLASLQQAGAQALPIVSLVSVLFGLILAFVGAVQLERFGASLYVADLVGISIVREMGAAMSAIVLAGRTGAAYASELGTMKLTQELDALTTLGISPMDYLVLPRLIALTIMIPLLCVYADFVGILGGAIVGVTMLNIRPALYYQETIEALTTTLFWGGVFKAAVYGLLVAAAGCFEGLRCGSSAAAVGRATTRAVVDGIVLVIIASGGFAIVFYYLGI